MRIEISITIHSCPRRSHIQIRMRATITLAMPDQVMSKRDRPPAGSVIRPAYCNYGTHRRKGTGSLFERSCSSSKRLPVPFSDDELVLFPQAVDAQADTLSRLQVDRRLLPHADARWGAGGDDVARLQAHEAADIAHQKGNA